MQDFLEIAGPILNTLRDDPTRPDLSSPRSTTAPPPDFDEIEGALGELYIDGGLAGIGPTGDLADEDIAAACKVYREVGLDVLAFYKSFRFSERPPFPGKWGVFILDVGIATIASEFTATVSGLPEYQLQQLAVETLLVHERYHFWIDAWAFGQEIAPITNDRRKRYEHYFSDSMHSKLTEYDYEESLANYYAFQKLRDHKLSNGLNAGRVIKPFFASCPTPYSIFQFDPTTKAAKEGTLASAVYNGFDPLRALGATNLLGLGGILGVLSASIRPPSIYYPFAGRANCPVHLLRVSGYAARVQRFQGPTLREFQDFLERYLSGQKERSDHVYFRIDNGEKIKFPNPHDKEVRGYELKNILLKAGMTHPEFIEARKITNYWKKYCPRSSPKEARA